MPSAEFTEWMAYYKLEPFGAERDNYHAAMVASLIANSNRKKNAPAIPVGDFMYRDRDTRKEAESRGFMAGLRALGKRK